MMSNSPSLCVNSGASGSAGISYVSNLTIRRVTGSARPELLTFKNTMYPRSSEPSAEAVVGVTLWIKGGEYEVVAWSKLLWSRTVTRQKRSLPIPGTVVQVNFVWFCTTQPVGTYSCPVTPYVTAAGVGYGPKFIPCNTTICWPFVLPAVAALLSPIMVSIIGRW